MTADVVAGQRVGGFIVLVDEEGMRHAVRCGAVLALSDMDETGTDTVMVLPGGRAVTIRRPLHEVLSWFG